MLRIREKENPTQIYPGSYVAINSSFAFFKWQIQNDLLMYVCMLFRLAGTQINDHRFEFA